MPSFLSKLNPSSKRNNPYLNAQHPSHTPLPPKQSQNPYPSIPPLRPVSPTISHNLLAEARIATNRDPITGTLKSPRAPTQNTSSAELASNARVNGALNAIEALGPSVERKAYLSRASQGTGSQFGLIAGEERRRAEEVERGGAEYYAPERRVEEYYGGGGRG
ncbi:hypothetical protein GQ44DRAFT_829940 [Phaeosphaeriaceae sp. PMI808]|nr:hypothetical protein GQ44DRAFT_829940 [Phaeosphaeriaceae sp. PMI808]